MKYLTFSLLITIGAAAYAQDSTQQDLRYESKLFRQFLKETYGLKPTGTDTATFYILPSSACSGTGQVILKHLQRIDSSANTYAIVSRYFAELYRDAFLEYEESAGNIKIDYQKEVDYMDIGCHNLAKIIMVGNRIIEIDTRTGEVMGELFYWEDSEPMP